MSKAIFLEQYSSGTNAPAGSTGTNVRALNATHFNNISGCSLNTSNNEVTVSAGTYCVRAKACSNGYAGGKVKLVDVSNGNTLVSGSSAQGVSTGQAAQSTEASTLERVLTLSAQTTFTVNYDVSSTGVGTCNLGTAVSDSEYEVYAELVIEGPF